MEYPELKLKGPLHDNDGLVMTIIEGKCPRCDGKNQLSARLYLVADEYLCGACGKEKLAKDA